MNGPRDVLREAFDYSWDGQMLFLVQHGFRVVAHDRRGHGRSSQASSGTT